MRLFFILLLCAVLSSNVCNAQKTQLLPSAKLSTALSSKLQHKTADSTDITLVFTAGAAREKSGTYRMLHRYHNTVMVRLPLHNVTAVVQDSSVVFADLAKTPKEELTTGFLDLAVNKINQVHHQFPMVTGTNILASVKEQHFDTTDIDYTGRYVATDAAASTFTTHASIMATTLAGAGNSSPFARGAAPGALLTSTSFASLLPESDSYYQRFNISIQNHSYGTVPENYYGAEAAAYDQNVGTNPTLVHVFSAGNSGTAAGTGPYAGLQGWANLTGNFKTAKNTLVVGAIDSFYNVAPASSKGPAFDGRIKPDLVAFGEDGSSGAAALTSGTVALLQQAYGDLKKKRPSAALVKAVLLNSADDLYETGPDYTSGYGSLNGYNAVKTILENRYREDSLPHGVLKKFDLAIPANAAQLRVTLAWTDNPAAVNAPVALVNDLDLVLKNTATGETWQPWVLNAAADADSITKRAERKRDTLNNVEQISLQAPAAGIYSLEITGRNIPAGTQAFALAWQVDTTSAFEWTFPTRSDPVIAGQSNILRWQTTVAGTGMLEYTTNGQDWQVLATGVNLQQPYLNWTAPDTLATARLRMRFSNRQPVATDTFVISKAATVQVGFACADSLLLYWKAQPAPQYRLYRLGNRYLEAVAVTSDTAVVLKTAPQQTPYYSVAPLTNGLEGMRSFTINYTAQGTGCYFRSFYAQAQNEQSAAFAAAIGTLYNVASVSFQKLQNNQFVTLQTINAPATTDFVFRDSSLVQGGNRFRLLLQLRSGATITSDAVNIFHLPGIDVFLYPNPVRSGQPVTIRTGDAGYLKLQIFNAAGTLLNELGSNTRLHPHTTLRLSKGLYFIHTIQEGGARHTQKLVVY